MITRRQIIHRTALAAFVPIFGPSRAAAATSSRPGFFAAKNIAEAGYVFGLPLVMNYGVMYEFVIDKSSSQYKAPFNTIENEANVFTYKDTAVPVPNSDTPYSLLWMDLRAEPMVISVPAVDPQRYYSVQLCDGNTYNYGYIGTRATGSEAGDYLVVGPDWNGETPAGVKKVFRSGTQLSIAIFRTQLFDSSDIESVKKVQAGYRAQALSTFLGRPAPPAAAAAIHFPSFSKELAKKNFFEYLDFALQFSPPAPNETEIRAKLASIGVGPGKTFNFKDLPIEQKLEIALGLKQGKSKVDAAAAQAGTVINGWQVSGLPGDSAHYNGDWLARAVAAQAGIYGNSPEEAMYPFTRKDSTGRTLDGRNNYTLAFPADQLPPVNAFWSITMYDGKSQLLIKNPINRYLINSPMLPGMKKNTDGSLTLYVQNKSPGEDRVSNWLPAPVGSIYLVMRLYWPRDAPPSILPSGRGTWQPPGVMLAAH
jgi:hypothetical protein